VLNPSSKSVNINLLEASRDPSDTLRDARDDGELIPYALYPDSGGLLPVAATDNGDIIYWLTRGDAADWIIVVNGSRSDDYEEFECNLTAFLKGLIDKSIICNIFPDDSFSEVDAGFIPVS
jgi:hypothetical protein